MVNVNRNKYPIRVWAAGWDPMFDFQVCDGIPILSC